VNDCTAIIVDDDKDFTTTYSQILENNGIKVMGSGTNGQDAVNLYKKHKPCCILLDMKMPKFDGNYAIKHIREFDEDAKIIIMTAYTESEPALDDVFAVIEKPSDIDDVIELVKQTCSD